VSGPSKPNGPERSIDYAIRDQDGCIVGEAFGIVGPAQNRPAHANATLWAAAPGMYELLDQLYSVCSKTADQLDGYAERTKNTFPAVSKSYEAEAAIYRNRANDIWARIVTVKELKK
jgi:hypothetical protein